MNYYVELTFSVNEDEVEQGHPTREEIIEAVYDNRIVPPGIIYNVTELEVHRL